MRTLVVGAIGGYFGAGCLTQITRGPSSSACSGPPSRPSSGLTIRSCFGDATVSKPPTILAENLRETFDLVLLSCKAYDLEGAITSFAPAVGLHNVILPLLNHMRHPDILDERFGRNRLLASQCLIAVGLNERHEIVGSVRRQGSPAVDTWRRDPHHSNRTRADGYL